MCCLVAAKILGDLPPRSRLVVLADLHIRIAQSDRERGLKLCGQFGLVVGEPAEFRFLSSTMRKNDPPGALIEDWGDELEELGPLEVTLPVEARSDDVVPVTLESHVTEVGTLELWCVTGDRGRRWKLELNIRDNEGSRGSA
jgi:hypothetical protein